MNQEIINKLNEAIKNNDIETIEKLNRDNNIQFEIKKINDFDKNSLIYKAREVINTNDINKIKEFEKKNNISINVQKEQNGNIKNVNLQSAMIKKIDPLKMVDNRNHEYFRDVPCNNDLFIIYNLASNHGLLEQESDILGAFILRWIRNKKVNFNYVKKKLFRRERSMIKFMDDVVIDDFCERQIYDFLKNISNNNILEYNELYKWLMNNEFKFNSFLQELKISSSKRMIQAGLLIESGNDGNSIEIRNNCSIIKYSHKSWILTSKYHDYLQQIVNFKNFINDFSLLDEKDAKHVQLWDDYLVVAHLLGLADMVASQLEELVPGFKVKNKYCLKKNKIIIKSSSNISHKKLKELLLDKIDN